MEDDSNTPAPAGTEVVQPDQQTDTIPDYVFFDPDEDTEEPAAPEMTEDDGQTDETEEVEAEGEDPEGEDPEGEPEAEADDEDDDTSEAETIELPDGTKVDREEVVKGYLRQSDYTRKATEVAEQRKSLEAENQRLNGITEAFIDHLSKMIPAPPDASLAHKDPNAYTRQKAAHESAVQQVQQIVQIGEQAKQVGETLSQQDRQRRVAEENAKLAEKFPETSNPKGREAFFSAAADAAEAVGFDMDELQAVDDHRLFALAHYAHIGMKAQEAKTKAKQKAAKAPPASPNKPATNRKPNRNREAMARLRKTGSIRDALKVDFD